MYDKEKSFPLGKCAIENITGIWQFKRPARFCATAESLPGHLLHYVASGSYRLYIEGRSYSPREGDLLYYYGSEDVIWEGYDEEVVFYSAGFYGTDIPVLSPGERVMKAPKGSKKLWEELYRLSSRPDTYAGHVMIYALLLQIIGPVFWSNNDRIKAEPGKWPEIEKMIRRDKLYHITADELSVLAGVSRSSLYQICRRETGSTPLSLIRRIRLEEGKGLLRYTNMRIGEVSAYLKYRRIHDFSREFKNRIGVSPTEYRAWGKSP